jgi:hypothetical protein
MAKARAIEGLKPDGSFTDAAARIIEVRASELIDSAHGVLDLGDIECLHDMRVATRRLRAALEVFEPCFPKRQWKAALRQVKALADALGERRDRDVTIAALESIAGTMSAPDRPGINTLIEDMRLEQAEANKALAPFVEPTRMTALGELLSALVAGAGSSRGEYAGGNVVELSNRARGRTIPRPFGEEEAPSRQDA